MKAWILRQLRDRYNRVLVPADDPTLWWDRFKRLLDERGASIALDVGANVGQYAQKLRSFGFGGVIHSFEPLRDSYGQLLARANADGAWHCHRLAVGASDVDIEMNVAGNAQLSSSILEMLETHERAAPESRYVGAERVRMTRLDSFDFPATSLLLKIDVQGYEADVLEGASETLKQVQVIQTELTLRPLYRGQLLIGQMLEFLDLKGFVPWGFLEDHRDARTKELLQVDGVFIRR
jgi:FkbM family methyltransferase